MWNRFHFSKIYITIWVSVPWLVRGRDKPRLNFQARKFSGGSSQVIIAAPPAASPETRDEFCPPSGRVNFAVEARRSNAWDPQGKIAHNVPKP